MADAGLFVIGLVLAALAGLMAFLVAYDEMGRHFPNRAAARRHAMRSGLTAFAFFAVLVVVLAAILPRLVS